MAHLDLDRIIPRSVVEMPSSGIRKFFDILDSMTDVTALTVGQPDFVTPWKIREAGITVPRGSYTKNYRADCYQKTSVW